MPKTWSRVDLRGLTAATAVTSVRVMEMRSSASSSFLYTERRLGRRTRYAGLHDDLNACNNFSVRILKKCMS